MNKKLMILFIGIIILPCAIALTGNGTRNNPFLISNPQDLIDYGATMYEGTGGCQAIGEPPPPGPFFTWTVYGVLANNIDLSSISNWIPISGGCGYNTQIAYFDGQGYTISGLKSTTGGIFGDIYGTVKNLNVDIVNAPWGIARGGVRFNHAGVFRNIKVTGNASIAGVMYHCEVDSLEYITVNLSSNVPAFAYGLYQCTANKLANYGRGQGVGTTVGAFSYQTTIQDSFSWGGSLIRDPAACGIINSYTAGIGWLGASWSIMFPGITASYYNDETANESAYYMYGIPQSSSWLQSESNLIAAGWNFSGVWYMGSSGYPELEEAPPDSDVNLPIVDFVTATFDVDLEVVNLSCGVHDNEGNVSIYFETWRDGSMLNTGIVSFSPPRMIANNTITYWDPDGHIWMFRCAAWDGTQFSGWVNSSLLNTSILSILSCGNGIINSGEDCDGLNLNGESCVGLGYDYGTLACSASCRFIGCHTYGGGPIFPGEQPPVELPVFSVVPGPENDLLNFKGLFAAWGLVFEKLFSTPLEAIILIGSIVNNYWLETLLLIVGLILVIYLAKGNKNKKKKKRGK
jgi:hypothetical protein